MSVRSAARSRASARSVPTRRSSQRTSRSGSQCGDSVVLLPLPKASRFMTVQTKKEDGQEDSGEGGAAPLLPIPNIFNKEVYFALNTRGGALWERLHREQQNKKEQARHDKGEFGDVVTAELNDATVDYNARFNLKDARTTIRMTLLKKITQQVERIAKQVNHGPEISKTEFVDACTAAGVSLTKEQIEKMFDAIDTDESGQIDVAEWKAACQSGDKKEMLIKQISEQIDQMTKAKGDQTISRDDFTAACTAAGLSTVNWSFDDMFDAIDKDGSGQIDVAEWKEACNEAFKAGDKKGGD